MLIVLALSARSHWDDQRWSDQAQTHRQVEGREDVAVLRGALVDEALLELVEDCAFRDVNGAAAYTRARAVQESAQAARERRTFSSELSASSPTTALRGQQDAGKPSDAFHRRSIFSNLPT